MPDKCIKINRDIDQSNFVNDIPNYQHVFKSVVCHHGRYVLGHYTTDLIRDNSLLTVSYANISVRTNGKKNLLRLVL